MTIPPNQEAYDKIKEWILSCKTRFHFEAMDNVIDLYGVRFPDNRDMKIMLLDLRVDHWNEVINQKNEKP